MQLVLDAPVARASAQHTCRAPRTGRVTTTPLCLAQRSQQAKSVLRRQQQQQPCSSSNVRSSVATGAAQVDVPPLEEKYKSEGWYAVVANAEFMLHDVQNESFAEQLREKVRYYKENNKEVDFFIVSEPAWLDQMFPDQAKRVGRPCVALVSRDRLWIKFMKLRLDRVLLLELGNIGEELLFKSNGPVPEFKPFENWTAPYAPYAPGWWEPFMKNGGK